MLFAGLVSASSVLAHLEVDEVEEVIVVGRAEPLIGDARTASEGTVGQVDLEIRPLWRPGDVLESVPGLIVTQHSGSGKSNQMFLRGFNLDHGTDFATWIDGMPVNMRTHGHGQGYTDINFLIPETVERLSYVKGPYHAELGDFSSAGGVHINTMSRAKKPSLSIGAGENSFGRLLAMGTMDVGDNYLTGAFEAQRYDGPWTDIEEDVDKLNGLLKVGGDNGSRSWSTTLMVYDNEWNSADQIPERAVNAGLISELGSIDTTLGGASSRASLSGQLANDYGDHRTEWNAYVIDYQMDLWSNFTYLLDDPENGDQFQQVDDRTIFGGSVNRFWYGGAQEKLQHRFGVEARHDDISSVGLYRTVERQRRQTVREDSVDQTSAGVFYELAWSLSDQWRAVFGLRGDYYRFDVDAGEASNAGSDSDSIVSPKGSLIYSFSDTTEAYLSYGRGFHSNDARGVTITRDPGSGESVDPVDPLVASEGFELGFKARFFDAWNTSLALWYLELDSELLFVGDAGTTEASRPSERHGIEFNNYWAVNDIWSVEADVSWTDARFADRAIEGRDIPGALKTVFTGAVSARYPNGLYGSFRLRYFSDAPLIEDGSVRSEGSTMANVAFGWSGRAWNLQLDVLNLFDSNDHDIDYFYASRLPGEPSAGVDDIHYHVFEPRQLRFYVTRDF